MITFLSAIIVLTAIGIVSWPLLKRTGVKSSPVLVEDSEVSELLTQKDATLFAISELESDYSIGSLSQSDYQELRNKYEEKAVALIKTVDELRIERGFGDARLGIDEEIESKVATLRASRNTTGSDIEARVSKLRHPNTGARDKQPCPGCGTLLPANAVFCSHCGAALNKKCPSCSLQVSTEALYCQRCGAALKMGGTK